MLAIDELHPSRADLCSVRHPGRIDEGHDRSTFGPAHYLAGGCDGSAFTIRVDSHEHCVDRPLGENGEGIRRRGAVHQLGRRMSLVDQLCDPPASIGSSSIKRILSASSRAAGEWAAIASSSEPRGDAFLPDVFIYCKSIALW